MSSSSSRSIVAVGAAVAAAVVVGVALMMSLGGSEPAVSVSGSSAVESSAPVTTAGPATTASTAIPQSAVGPASDRGDLLMTFGMAWSTTDWDLMRTVADQSVLDAAEEWAIAGGRAEINADNLDVILDSCFQDESGATRCEFLYLPPEGFALIYSAAFTATDQGLVISGLIPGGDAG